MLRIQHPAWQFVIGNAVAQQFGNKLLGQKRGIEPDVRLNAGILRGELCPKPGLSNGRPRGGFGWLHETLLGGCQGNSSLEERSARRHDPN
jgi:hypothetical protein